VGTITGAVVVLGKRSITDIPTLAMLLITILLLWKMKKLPEPVIIAAAAVAGLIAFPLLKS
jgi:chromate transporter